MVNPDPDELFYLIALTLVDGIGPATSKKLVAHCGSARNAFNSSTGSLKKIGDIGTVRIGALKNFSDFGTAEREMEFIIRTGVSVLPYYDDAYPARLRHCNDGPLVLYYKGGNWLNHPRIISVVGTRNATPYGRDMTEQVVSELKSLDVVVVSGMAYGTDINAHRCCISHGIPTIGVFAHGLDRIYPAAHRRDARKMTGCGGWLTDFPSGTIPDRSNFPKRNRIIAGMSDAVIVIEAAMKGGALITADLANSYNRDVFAVPGRVGQKYSEGCNNLIKTHRAALFQSVNDIRYIMGWEVSEDTGTNQNKLFTELTGNEKAIVELLKTGTRYHKDDLCHELRFTSGQLSSLLLELELRDVVRSLPGNLYELV